MSNIIIHKITDAKLLDSAKQTISKGTIHTIIGFVIFRSDDQSIEFWIPHSHIESVERLPQLPCGSPITLQLKTTRIIRFALLKDSDCQAFYASLRSLSKPDRVRDLAAFSYVPADCQQLISRGRPSGWVTERVFADYLRMGLPNDQWFQCILNLDYELCPTYPRLLFTCSRQNETLKGSAAFRSSARLPMLSYLRPTTLAAICRSSQPLAGMSGISNNSL
jgi:myotubularin-related protein 6/7/8